MINFSIHQVRAGSAGASEDFEQMLALLVQATSGNAHLVFANPGDWGIDVLIGDLSGEVTIWQAKYFVRGVAEAQKRQIKKSFSAALTAAATNGYRVGRWVLCIPSSMDAPTTRWWHSWKTEQERDTGVRVQLWDETELRHLLLTSAADHVRRHYYNPYRDGPGEASHDSARMPAGHTATESGDTWQGGTEYRVGGEKYLLHEGTAERVSPDRSWAWREATADQLGSAARRVRLREVDVRRPGPVAQEHRSALRAQAELVAELAGRAGLPRLVQVCPAPARLTVSTVHPPGRRWAEVFGPGPTPADRFVATAVLAAAAGLCASLAALHARGASHRALDPDAIFVDADRCLVRDVGLAAIPPSPEEAGARYRAPEQTRMAYRVGARTDVYQLAGIVYHTLVGHPPTPGASPPVRATLPDVPEPLDAALLRAMETDPRRRPDIRGLAAAFRQGRRTLSRGAAW